MTALLLAALLGASPFVVPPPLTGGTLSGNLTLPVTGALKWGTTRTILTAPGDGQLNITNAAGSVGVMLYAVADSLLWARDRAGGDNATIRANAAIFNSISVQLSYGLSFAASSTIYANTKTTDAAALTILEAAGHSYWKATGANQAGGNLTLAGGIGSRVITVVTAADTAGDTLTLTVNGTATVLTEGVAYACAAVTAAECACAIYTYLVATPVSGVTAARTDATCTDAKVGFTPTAGSTVTLTVAPSDAVAITVVSGADGQLVVPVGSLATPGVAFYGDQDTGIYRPSANALVLATNAVTALSINSSSNIIRARINQTDVGATCTVGDLAIDTGGATVELCYCAATNTWYCWSPTTLTGPTD